MSGHYRVGTCATMLPLDSAHPMSLYVLIFFFPILPAAPVRSCQNAGGCRASASAVAAWNWRPGIDFEVSRRLPFTHDAHLCSFLFPLPFTPPPFSHHFRQQGETHSITRPPALSRAISSAQPCIQRSTSCISPDYFFIFNRPRRTNCDTAAGGQRRCNMTKVARVSLALVARLSFPFSRLCLHSPSSLKAACPVQCRVRIHTTDDELDRLMTNDDRVSE